jgi:hypothetical protein
MGQMTKREHFLWLTGLGLIGIGAVLWPFAMIGLLGIAAMLAGTITCGRATLAAPARPGSQGAVLVRSVLILAGLLGMLIVAAVTPVVFTRVNRFAIPEVGRFASLLGLWLAVPTVFTAGVIWRKSMKVTEAGTLWLTMFAIFPLIVVLYANTNLPRSL